MTDFDQASVAVGAEGSKHFAMFGRTGALGKPAALA